MSSYAPLSAPRASCIPENARLYAKVHYRNVKDVRIDLLEGIYPGTYHFSHSTAQAFIAVSVYSDSEPFQLLEFNRCLIHLGLGAWRLWLGPVYALAAIEAGLGNPPLGR
jgi:hypothetical protein